MDTLQKRKAHIAWLQKISAEVGDLCDVVKPAGTPMTILSVAIVTNCVNLMATIEREIARVRRLRAGTREPRAKK